MGINLPALEIKIVKRNDKISIHGVLKYIKARNGKIFSIKFFKRTTGELRLMSCRTGVKKHLSQNPHKPGLDFKSYDLISVFDMKKQAYRSIPIEGIYQIKIEGSWYKVTHNPVWIVRGAVFENPGRKILVHDPITRKRGEIPKATLEEFCSAQEVELHKDKAFYLPKRDYSRVQEQ